ncbi:rhodanese-like domain-containing protein [Chlorobium sp. KB01]|uniref:rhodanese-like domain-containing protein n=1 Tax=Chlorobium sp. KB01 TaxID=1917528 RepID=UPI0009F9CC43|nr:rhodanese-like domain-containing protein [Chlorobium sp. KB01]
MMKNSQEISPAKALALIKKGALLVDVREPKEVSKKSFDVSNILQIPLRELKTRFQEIPVDRKVVIACHVGNRGMVATRFLVNNGYSKAVNMQHGIAGWEKEGLPVRKELKPATGSWFRKLFSRMS